MAITKVNTATRCVVAFQERELAGYRWLEAGVVKWQNKKCVNFALPFITWQGHDLRVARDLSDALKKVGNFQAKIKGTRANWNAHAHEPTILREDKIRVPVYANHSEPYVQAERVDGYVKWSVQGHYFNDDLPSVVAYVAAVTKLVELVKSSSL